MAQRSATVLSTPTALTLSLQDIEEDPHNARQVFDEARLKALGESIRAQGLLYPIVVRKVGAKHRVVDGHRRLRAAQLIGLKEIRCEVVELDDQAAALAAATANLQREDLTPYEQARAFKTAIDLGMSKKELCERAGIVFNTLKARLQLLELPESVGQRIDVGGFTIQHAQSLLPLKDAPELLEAAINGLDKQKALPRANDMPRTVEDILRDAGKVRSVGEGFNTWEHRDLQAKLAKLPHVSLKMDNGFERILVTDPKAYDEALEEGLAAEKAKDAKARAEQAKLNAAGKGEKAKERRQRELDQLAEKEARRLELAAMVAVLQKDSHVATAVFEVLRTFEMNDRLLGIHGYGGNKDGSGAWKAAGAAAGADVEAISSWLDKDGYAGKGTPAWFTKLKPGRQLAFLVGLLGANELATAGFGDDSMVVALTGKKAKEWSTKGRKEAERTLAAQAAPPGKDPTAVRLVTADDRVGDRAGKSRIQLKLASTHEPPKPKKASQAKPAKKSAKNPVKVHAGLAKAKAKLAKKGT